VQGAELGREPAVVAALQIPDVQVRVDGHRRTSPSAASSSQSLCGSWELARRAFSRTCAAVAPPHHHAEVAEVRSAVPERAELNHGRENIRASGER
jgi:acetoin utilization deacetylase AcuC-like enzyme